MSKLKEYLKEKLYITKDDREDVHDTLEKVERVIQNYIDNELKFYLVNSEELIELPTDEESINNFISLSEKLGTVYSLNGFVEAFNKEEVNTATQFILVK